MRSFRLVATIVRAGLDIIEVRFLSTRNNCKSARGKAARNISTIRSEYGPHSLYCKEWGKVSILNTHGNIEGMGSAPSISMSGEK